MKKLISFIVFVMIFCNFSYAQNLSEVKTKIEKSFFKGKKAICVKFDDFHKVAIYEVEKNYYAISVGLSASTNMSQQIARINFELWLVNFFGEIKITNTITELGYIQTKHATGDIFNASPIKFDYFSIEKENKEFFLQLYNLPGEILVNEKPIDIKKIL